MSVLDSIRKRVSDLEQYYERKLVESILHFREKTGGVTLRGMEVTIVWPREELDPNYEEEVVVTVKLQCEQV